ncbi:hypothetical protein [Oceanobacter kriegii]|uniref:hypothetical protein n=1 Tax=Oceanobacter kriegii TaxID=64972 RepID=UPI000429DE58|nr:hypothetical protein [Oceanobacter kriegii]
MSTINKTILAGALASVFTLGSAASMAETHQWVDLPTKVVASGSTDNIHWAERPADVNHAQQPTRHLTLSSPLLKALETLSLSDAQEQRLESINFKSTQQAEQEAVAMLTDSQRDQLNMMMRTMY